jgi:putative aldouronate transport system permease protein
MAQPQLFNDIYVWSGVWQSMGFNSIIYFAALSGISPELHEAAIVDGASKFKRILHIDIPGILPTVSILLILNFGSLMAIGFEKAFLLQNDINTVYSEIISTHVYKQGLIHNDISFSTAIGLMNTVVNAVLLITVNTISGKLSGNSLF